MKAWIVRFVSLYVFNTVMLLVIGMVLPKVSVGWSALWGGVILTIATIWVKPLVGGFFRKRAADKGKSQNAFTRKLVEYGIVYVVALLCWLLVVWLSSVKVQGWFWGNLLAAVLLLVGWAIYDLAIDDVMERVAARAYDRVTGKSDSTAAAAPAPQSPRERAATEAGRRELNDGLTDEQRKLLDGLS